MGTIKRIYKRGISFLLSIITIISLIIPVSLTVYADEDYSGSTRVYSAETAKGYAGSMFKTYINGGQDDLKIQDITEEEFRAFAILISNFVIPGYTDPSNLYSDITVKVNGAEGKYNTWKNFCKIWKKSFDENNDTSLMADLKNKYESYFNIKVAKKLYDSTGTEMKVSDILSADGICKNKKLGWKDESGTFVTMLDTDSYAVKAMLSFVRAVDVRRFDETLKDDAIWVSPFGDICAVKAKVFTVVIPACLNPASFEYNDLGADNKLYINNTFFMSNFLEDADLTELNSLPGTDNFIDDAGNFNTKGYAKLGGWAYGSYFTQRVLGINGSASCFMHVGIDSFVPYLQRSRGTIGCFAPGQDADTNIAGLAGYIDVDYNGDNNKSDDGNRYANLCDHLAFTQPLWSNYLLWKKSSTGVKNIVAITSKSKMINNDNIVYYNDDRNGFSDVNLNGRLTQFLGLFNYFKPNWIDQAGHQSGFDTTQTIINQGNWYFFRAALRLKKSDGKYLSYAHNEYDYEKDTDKEDGTGGGLSYIKEAQSILNKGLSSEVTADKDADDYEDKFLTIVLKGALEDSNNNRDSTNIESRCRVTSFYVPLDKTVSKIGLFNSKINYDSGSMEVLSTINYTDDGEDTVLSKIGHNASQYTTTNNNAAENKNEWQALALPEYLYTLYTGSTSVFKGDNSIKLTDNGLNLCLERGLFTNIYWGYIEDIVGITSEDVKKGIEGEDEGINPSSTKTFKHLPPMVDDGFKKTLFSALGDDDSWTKEQDEEATAKRNGDITDRIYKILNIGETVGNGLKDAAKYVTNWLKAMVDSLFIGWHNHMIGVDTTAGWTGTVSNIGNATKSGTYSTAMGYMTTPTFNSLPITGWIMANFTLIYVILMIFIVVILLMMVITRARRLPQAILIFICMAFLIVLPANMLNGAISISNEAAEKTFSNKFQYWAVMQHAEYVVNQSTAKTANQAALLDNLDRNSEATKVGGVTLKWMAPKKWGIAEQISAAANNAKGLRLFLYLAGDVLDQEDYSNYQAGDTYIYRPYLALFTEAHSLHKRQQSNLSISEKSDGKTNNLYKVSQNIVNKWTSNNDKYKILNSPSGKKLGTLYFNNKNTYETKEESINGKKQSVSNNFFRYITYRGDSILRSAVGGNGAGVNGTRSYPVAYFDSYYGNSQLITDKSNIFKNNERIYAMYMDEQLIKCLFTFNVNNVYWNGENVGSSCGLWLSNKKNPNTRHYSGESAQDDLDKTYYSSGVQTFFDYSESPYYYFYNVFMDMQIHSDNGTLISGDEDFLALLLSDETFKVTNQQSPAYGEFKDYLDMEGLFKFVIPLLDYGNANASKYFEKYGSKVERTDFLDDSDYESTSTSETSKEESSKAESSNESSGEESSTESSNESSKTEGTTTITKDPKTKAEDSYNKHKQQLQAVYNMYCPWVDQFLAANTKSERIKSGYGWVELMNPCNPADYQYFGRPMAFSKAEATIRGYKDYDLSNVETKIQKILSDSYYDIIELINYKDLTSINPTDAESYAAKEGWKGNEILVSAAAMIATFHFNQEFSDNGFMSTDTTLYPQSYELKNMNFDAYLRIIMGNSMGINQVSLMRSDSNSMTVYEEFIHETSVWSALVLIVEDLLAVFIIPVLKIMLITVIFVLALALAVSCIINKPEHMIKIFLKTYIFPLFAMIAIFVVHTLVISWFVGEGSSSGLIDTHSISVTTGDPTVTLLLMIVVDLGTIILMWKLLKFAAKSTAKYIQDIGTGIAALGKGTFSGVAKIITAAAGVGTAAVGAASLAGGAIKSTASGVVGAGKAISHKAEYSRQTKLDKERNKLLKSGGTSGTSDKTKGKTGGSSGAGAASNKPTNNNSQQTNSSLAADVKAIRQKLEKGFNPEGMKPDGKNDGKKSINSGSGNQKPSDEAKEKQKQFMNRRATAQADKALKDPAAARQQAQQLHSRKQEFDALRKSSGAKFDKATGKWTAANKADADRLNGLQKGIAQSRLTQKKVSTAQTAIATKKRQVRVINTAQRMAQKKAGTSA